MNKKQKGKSISIKEISELSGYSVATVSRVINNNGRFSKETEQKIKQIIADYGYQPNMLARGLRTSKSQIVGAIVPDISNEFFAKVAIELQNRLLELDYSTLICNTNEDYQTELRYLNMLKSQQISGIVYIAGDMGKNDEFLNIPTVYIDRKPIFSTPKDIVLIESNNQKGGYIATQELINKGCRKIGVLVYKDAISSHGDRLIGYKNALKANGIIPEDELIITVDKVDIQTGYNKTCKLIKTVPHVDGIFCSSDLLAFGAVSALNDLEVAVPDNVKIVGFDDISLTTSIRPNITTVRQSVESFGTLAANAIVSMMSGENLDKKEYLIDVELISRETT